MIDTLIIDHHIQKHILGVLMYQKYARFRDMRPENVDTNLYSYHLKQLLKQKLVKKTAEGYTLDTLGLSFVDRINATTKRVSMQPKIITMAVIQDGYGGILMYRKLRQPFIDTWTVPFGKVHDKDPSLLDSVQREIKEKVEKILADVKINISGIFSFNMSKDTKKAFRQNTLKVSRRKASLPGTNIYFLP